MSDPTSPDGPRVSNSFSVTAMILALLGFLLSPIFLGVPAIVVAALAGRRQEPLARRAMLIAAIALILGVIAGLWLNAIRN
jgi:hypothetical protein